MLIVSAVSFQDLIACLKKALSGDLENLLLQLLMLPEHFDAQRLQDAMVVGLHPLKAIAHGSLNWVNTRRMCLRRVWERMRKRLWRF